MDITRIHVAHKGGFTESVFNLNRLNVNSVWTQLMQINLHSMRIIFIV